MRAGSIRALACALTVGGALVVSGAVAAQADVFTGWVGLYEPDALGWLENENRLTELCRDAPAPSACRSEMLAPRVDVLALHADPDERSERVGDLVVTAVPGRGLYAHYRPADTSTSTRFEPDLFLRDWGYGPPFFHQTVLDREGGWVRLPAGPWEEPAWVRRADPDLLLGVRAGMILELDGEGVVVVEARADSLLLRSEQEADMWCQPGDPPALAPASPQWHSRASLSDERGHLRIGIRYMKGC